MTELPATPDMGGVCDSRDGQSAIPTQNPRFMNCRLGTCQAMSPEQEQHLARIRDRFAAAVDAKYRSGAAEHGNDLLSADVLKLLDMAMEECVDQWCYLFTLRERLERPRGEHG